MTSRRLTAILAADIAGYSSLMGADDVETVAALKGHQSVVLPMISGFEGRVIDTAGDGILSEFPSVFNAVRCAVAIQDVMRERNAAIDTDRRMLYRIGVNQGDVLFDDERIYGEGINIAARLEALCDPGGICISAKVYEEVKDRFRVRYTDIGEQTLKNIAMPVRVYQIGLGGPAPASGTVAPSPLVARAEAAAPLADHVLPGMPRSRRRLALGIGALCAAGVAAIVAWPHLKPLSTAALSKISARQIDHSFDGEWEGVLTGGEDCAVKTARQRFAIKDRQIILVNGKTGTVDADGVVHYLLPGRANPDVVVEFTGRLTKGTGQVTYRVIRGRCVGTAILARIAP